MANTMRVLIEPGSTGVRVESMRFIETNKDIEDWIEKKVRATIILTKKRCKEGKSVYHRDEQACRRTIYNNGTYLRFRVYDVTKCEKPRITISNSKRAGTELVTHITHRIMAEEDFLPMDTT